MDPDKTLNSEDLSTLSDSPSDLVSTMPDIDDGTDPEGANNTQDAGDDESGKTVVPDDSGDDKGRLDENPRFKEVITERDTLKERTLKAEAALAAVQAVGGGNNRGDGDNEQEPDFQDISEMSAEDIKDGFDEDPKAFLANLLRQARHEVRQDVLTEVDGRENQGEQDRQSKAVIKTYDKYAKDNPSFDKLWDSGEIEAFMTENPGHNAMSAHMALTAGDREKDIQKTADETAITNLKLKRNAQSMGTGGGGNRGTSGSNDDLKNPNKHGGADNVLLTRHLQRVTG